MPTLILDREIEKELRDRRAAWGADRYDEVWEGVCRITPMPNIEHQQIASRFTMIFGEVLEWSGRAEVQAGVNVGDREKDWRQNYRVPDVAVFLRGGRAKRCGIFWLGGPDFVIEIAGPDEEARDKLSFYSKVGVREILIVDRDPWSLELMRLRNKELVSVGRAYPSKPGLLASQVIPFTFRLVPASDRPNIEVVSTESGRIWSV